MAIIDRVEQRKKWPECRLKSDKKICVNRVIVMLGMWIKIAQIMASMSNSNEPISGEKAICKGSKLTRRFISVTAVALSQNKRKITFRSTKNKLFKAEIETFQRVITQQFSLNLSLNPVTKAFYCLVKGLRCIFLKEDAARNYLLKMNP